MKGIFRFGKKSKKKRITVIIFSNNIKYFSKHTIFDIFFIKTSLFSGFKLYPVI